MNGWMSPRYPWNAIAVVVTALAGGLSVSLLYALRHMEGEPPLPPVATWGAGAVIGALLGSLVERRRLDLVPTIAGALVFVVPFWLLADRVHGGWAVLAALAPVAGASAGNLLGAKARGRPPRR